MIRDALLNDEADVGVFYRVGNDDAPEPTELVNNTLVLVGFTTNCECSILLTGNITPIVINEPQCVSGRYLRALASNGIAVENTIELLSIESISVVSRGSGGRLLARAVNGLRAEN